MSLRNYAFKCFLEYLDSANEAEDSQQVVLH